MTAKKGPLAPIGARATVSELVRGGELLVYIANSQSYSLEVRTEALRRMRDNVLNFRLDAKTIHKPSENKGFIKMTKKAQLEGSE